MKIVQITNLLVEKVQRFHVHWHVVLINDNNVIVLLIAKIKVMNYLVNNMFKYQIVQQVIWNVVMEKFAIDKLNKHVVC
jgi:hypothetical protein